MASDSVPHPTLCRTWAVLALGLALCACGGSREMVAADCPKDASAGIPEGVAPPEDDGFNTFLRFPGRMVIPTITVKDEHGQERAVERTTNPDTGEVVLHGVFPTIVMRRGNHTACFHNRAWNPIGRRP